jgi:nitrogenase molybdenum-iron protein beta chain
LNYCTEQHIVTCAIGGIYTALAIEKILPIMHCGSGCQISVGGVLACANGGQNATTFEETILPCTNFCDADVVFGGGERLRELVRRALDYYDADIFLIVDGCTAEIVGDDIEEIASYFADRQIPVLQASLPGFKGNNLWGHSEVLKAIIEQYVKPTAATNPKQVNVFGIVPFYDTMWVATLEKLEELLIRMGLEPNIIYGRGKGVGNVDRIPSAGFNLVLGPWIDLDTAELLETKFDTPFLHCPTFPVGPTETSKFIRRVAEYAALDKTDIERYIEDQEDRFFWYVDRTLTWMFDNHNGKHKHREFVVNASASQALGITKFLINDIGIVPRKIFIPEDVPEKHHDAILTYFRDVEYAHRDEIEVVFTDDGGLCEATLKGEDFTFRRTFLFGSVFDMLFAEKNSMSYVSVSSPYGDYLIGNKTYFGYDGGIELMTDMYNAAADVGIGMIG